ncbi:MAG: hypothetical protein AAF317_21235, partial [Pseudomonadota bacterium]
MNKVVVCCVAAVFLAACSAPRHSEKTLTAIELSSAQAGEVLAVRAIESPYSETLIDDGAGARFGGFAGLFIGSFFGEGSGRAAGALIGLGVGALTGAIIENETKRVESAEYLIRLDSGEEVVVVAKGAPQHVVGAPVRIID